MNKHDELIAKFLHTLNFINRKYDEGVLTYEDMCVLMADVVNRFTKRFRRLNVKVERRDSELIIWRRKKRPEYIT